MNMRKGARPDYTPVGSIPKRYRRQRGSEQASEVVNGAPIIGPTSPVEATIGSLPEKRQTC